MLIDIPVSAHMVLDRLKQQGFEAFLVGGCVRDALLHKKPGDWDICTNARPEEILSAFSGWKTSDTGAAYGSIAVWAENEKIEITTFRSEAAYSDGRHPDAVVFVDSVEEDLKRRDFTVNAMAFHEERGLQDPFSGLSDLERGLIRCIGDPMKRFDEDVLRILRAVRFMASLGFSVEEKTDEAIHALKDKAASSSGDRIRTEFLKMISGAYFPDAARKYRDVLEVIFPDLARAAAAEDGALYERMLAAVSAADDLTVKLAVFFRFLMDGTGESGGYHAETERRRVRLFMEETEKLLRFDGKAKENISLLLLHYNDPLLPKRGSLVRLLAEVNEENLKRLFLIRQLQKEGAEGEQTVKEGTRIPSFRGETAETLCEAEEMLRKILAEQPCLTVKDMRISGKDLLAEGFPQGRKIGETLNRLLWLIQDGELPNEREALISYIRCLTLSG